ncbi:MFS transporter [Sphingomonas sp. LT1P40]|uniref:MFS transporter n=1 Tax=Alteristakelama amylovorans TaxID=3096166 RepID=UPI002FCAFF7D
MADRNDVTGATADPATPAISRKQIAGVCVGNAIEFYDFVAYAYFAAQIGRTFFPSETPGVSLLASLATFGVGFFTRPLGALILGRFADRVGRKPAMLVSFGLMGFASVGLPLIPPYAAIGVAAPILVVAMRLLQGFAIGGEVGASTAFLMEAAPPDRRGLYVSFQAMSADIASLTAGMLGLILASTLDAAELDSWGWRVALLAGAVIIPVGLILRRTLNETLVPLESGAPPPHIPNYWRAAIAGFCLIAAATTTNYLLKYMTTYASSTLGMATTVAFGATVVIGLCGVFCDPLGGWLSDRFGRKRVMALPWTFLVIAVFPCFALLESQRSAGALYLACGVLACASTLASSVFFVAITEALPHRVRSAALSLIYACAVSIFGGSAQFLVAWITRMTGNPMTPAWYMICGAVVGLIAIRMLPETAPIRLRALQACAAK